MLAQRVLSAAVLAPLVLVAVAVGREWYLALAALVVYLGIREFNSLLHGAGYSPLPLFGLVLGLGFLLDAYPGLGRILPPVLSGCLLASLSWLVLRHETDRNFADWATTWIPPIYVGFMLSYLVSLRFLPSGDRWVYLVLAITWATDIAAYLVGKAVGKHGFFRSVSPKKTAEGALGGVAAGALVGGIVGFWFGAEFPGILLVSLVAAMAAEAGDLAESLVKRQLRVKDSSSLIPGHGGVLDRMDSLLFVGVVVYYWAVWIGGMQ